MFGKGDVKQVVDCAVRALESEERHLVSCFEARHWDSGDNGPGICCNLNERYYQFIIWRELMKSFPLRSKTERGDYDLAFYDDANKLQAYAEIKGRWSDSGKPELPGIKRDLKGKLGIASVPGVMLILTSHERAIAKGNFDWLADQLQVNRNDMVIRSFPVSPGQSNDDDWEFAVIGFLVTPST